jgi:hypothetical protein
MTKSRLKLKLVNKIAFHLVSIESQKRGLAGSRILIHADKKVKKVNFLYTLRENERIHGNR